MWQLSRHHACVKHLCCHFFIFTIVDLKHIVVLSESLLHFPDKLTHKHLRPYHQQNRFLTLHFALILFLKHAHISVKHKFYVEGSREAGVKHYRGEVVGLQSIPHFQLCLYILRTDHFFIRNKLVTTDSFKSLEVAEVYILSMHLRKAIDKAGFVVAVKLAWVHAKFGC